MATSERQGVFIDSSEYQRNNFDFASRRLDDLAKLADKHGITVLQTDFSVSEVGNLINRHIAGASDLSNRDTSNELAAELLKQFKRHLDAVSCTVLSISDVDASVIFDSYFRGYPPFDRTKSKIEFSHAFSLQRLAIWADETKGTACLVGPNPELKRICDCRPRLRYFETIEAFLDHINRADAESM